MTERKSIGQILMGLGRITEDDVTTALEYQRENGGYFGEALVACGLVSEQELEWGLASQFDLPYVFPEADAVDLEAAALVTPEWALTHLTLPIVKTAEALQVVVDSPLKDEAIAELRAKTELDVEMGLASPTAIRELIRQVYARAAALDEQETDPLSLENTLDEIVACDAPRWGISVRGPRAHAWWDDAGTIRRRKLDGNWHGALDRVLSPGPQHLDAAQARAGWDAEVDRSGEVGSVHVRCLSDESGREYLFVPRDAHPGPTDRFTPPAEGIVSEIRALARSGTARFAVTTEPETLGDDILPHLPALTLEPSSRSVYITTEGHPSGAEAFSHHLPRDASSWEREFEELKAYRFDVAAIDLPRADEWSAGALDVGSVTFLRWREADLDDARDAGVRWRLHVAKRDDGELSWSLESLTE